MSKEHTSINKCGELLKAWHPLAIALESADYEKLCHIAALKGLSPSELAEDMLIPIIRAQWAATIYDETHTAEQPQAATCDHYPCHDDDDALLYVAEQEEEYHP